MQGHLPDLVEEEGAAVGHLEVAPPVLARPREGALARPEELRFEELGGNGRAVDGHEGAIMARPREVDGAGEELLAHPRLTVDEHRGVEIDDGAEHVEHGVHARAPRHDVPEGESLLVPPDGSSVGRLEGLELDGAANDKEELGRLEGLDEIVLGAEPHGLHRGLDGAIGGHNDDGEVGMLGPDLSHQTHAVQPGQAPVREHEVHVLGFEGVQSFLGALHRQDLVPRKLERAMERAQEDFVVVDEQETLLHGVPPARGCASPTAGKEIRTRVPRPDALSITMSPP